MGFRGVKAEGKLSYVRRSGLLFKLMTAADAGNVLLAGAALHPKQHLAVGAFEILVVPAVFHTLHELAELGLPAGGELDILPVFREALLVIAGEDAEERPDIERHADERKQADAGEAAQERAGEAGNQREHAEVVGTVASHHETGEGFAKALHKGHGEDSFPNSEFRIHYFSNSEFRIHYF